MPLSQPICLLDDDSSVLRAISRILASIGLTSRAFQHPHEFLDYVAAQPVPLVVLDISMPLMNGMEVFAILRERHPATRIIFITGHDDPACRATVLAQGADAFFPKPFNDREFIHAVRASLAAFQEAP